MEPLRFSITDPKRSMVGAGADVKRNYSNTELLCFEGMKEEFMFESEH